MNDARATGPDLIQPSFMFMVGVAMAFSYAKRSRLGQSYRRMMGHAALRSIILVFLGIFLISDGRPSTNWSLMNVLTQIGLGYFFLFLLWGRPFFIQAIAALVVLVAVLLLYQSYPYAGIDFDHNGGYVGVSPAWAKKHLTGIDPAWHKNANVGHAIDLWLLNLLPRENRFVYNSGGYQTINFIPSIVTMLFGLMCGELLRSKRQDWIKLLILIFAGAAGIIAGLAIEQARLCPIVKRVWTPSWTLYSGGCCCLILAAFYLVVDVLRFRWWTFPLVVVGMNSIAIYCMSMTLKPWAARTWKTHFGDDVFLLFGELYAPTVQATLVGLLFWLACWWMYRQRIFIRI